MLENNQIKLRKTLNSLNLYSLSNHNLKMLILTVIILCLSQYMYIVDFIFIYHFID